jgi:hypothetical protein
MSPQFVALLSATHAANESSKQAKKAKRKAKAAALAFLESPKPQLAALTIKQAENAARKVLEVVK